MQPHGSQPTGTATRAASDMPPTPVVTAKRSHVRARDLPPVRPFWQGLWLATICMLIITGMLALIVWRLGAPLPDRLPSGALLTTPQAIATTTPLTTSPTPPAATPTPPVSVDQAWGSRATLTSFTTQLPNSANEFQATAIAPDGLSLLGYLVLPQSGGHTATAQAGILTIATKQFTAIGVPTSDGAMPPTCCMTDGRYVVASDSDQPGASCAPCHIRYWSYDRQTGQSRLVAKGSAYGAIDAALLDHGLLLFETQTNGWQMANLATGTISPAPPLLQKDAALAFAWPLVLHATPGVGPLFLHALNLQTGVDIDLSTVTGGIGGNEGAVSATLSGDTLIFAAHVNAETLAIGQIEHLTTAGAQATTIGNLSATTHDVLLTANARLITFQNSAIVWDRAEQRPVLTSSAPNATTALAGHFLAVIEPAASPWLPEHVTLYDTATLSLSGS